MTVFVCACVLSFSLILVCSVWFGLLYFVLLICCLSYVGCCVIVDLDFGLVMLCYDCYVSFLNDLFAGDCC